MRAPWAQAILDLDKDVENRSWETFYRGEFLIHCGLRFDGDAAAPLSPLSHSFMQRTFSTHKQEAGAILGAATLVGCVRNSRSKWAQPNSFHFLLSKPRRLDKPLEWRGKLGLFYIAVDELLDRMLTPNDRRLIQSLTR